MRQAAIATLLCLLAALPLRADDDMFEHWRRATVAVGRLVPSSTGSGEVFATIGSAVLVAKDPTHVCLLTAKHVFFDPAQQYIPDFIRIRLPKDSQSLEEDQGVKVDLRDGDKTIWKSLDDGSDLAVVKSIDLAKYWNIHAVSLADFGTDSDTYQGAQVLVFGYPVILGQDYLKTPYARGGIVSWIDPEGGLSKPFLIDANVFSGNSGGPVFHVRSGFQKNGSLALGGGFALIGIVVRDAVELAPVVSGGRLTMTPDPLNGIPQPNVAMVQNIGGIGIVEPVSKARDLVNKFCFD